MTSQRSEITLTGIVLTADHRCAKTHVKEMFCRSSDWALASGRKTYLLYGDIPSLERFERKRVNVSGVLEEVGVGGDRLYTNYPNYDIYAQFDDASVP